MYMRAPCLLTVMVKHPSGLPTPAPSFALPSNPHQPPTCCCKHPHGPSFKLPRHPWQPPSPAATTDGALKRMVPD
ncbi:hypothetical protein FQA47_020706 [Oryzias melastigma]|uniref:Uncharacterized protein n=1 Tax=Oryzias melastigma TaxID=30732 RepID=A0A834FEK9_ORYME|nr:hypothetical protein FQA47_020706 [Oryzias melastigma]